MSRYITAVITFITLAMFAGCATESPRPVHQANEPFPGPMSFKGDFDSPPVPRFMPRTVFPPFLIDGGVRGSATVLFRVKADGYVDEVKVESATEPAFGGSALGTIGRMVFKPATKNGVPVTVTGKVAFLSRSNEERAEPIATDNSGLRPSCLSSDVRQKRDEDHRADD